jgi:hypothetical protein
MTIGNEKKGLLNSSKPLWIQIERPDTAGSRSDSPWTDFINRPAAYRIRLLHSDQSCGLAASQRAHWRWLIVANYGPLVP